VVTASPSATEIVAALGAADRIVGIDDYSTYPPEVASLPRVGDFVNPSFEAIIELEPDLVILAAVQEKLAPVLRAAGLRTLVLDIHAIADVRAGLVSVGAALGLEARAAAEVDRIDDAVEAASARGRARRDRLRVLAVIDRPRGRLGRMVVVGPGAWLDELMAIVGAANALAEAGRPYINIGPEEVARAAPQVILETARPGQTSAAGDWRALPDVPAVAAERVHMLDDPIYSAPTPRIVAALDGLETVLYGRAMSAP
jgi:iron complex transport system substrate-binding protein